MKTKKNQATLAKATPDKDTLPTVSLADTSALYMAFELGSKEWKMAITDGRKQARLVTVREGDLQDIRDEIRRSKTRFKLSAQCRVLSCYEAGRDGFWLHRFLLSIGVENAVVDSSSIEVNRRSRRAKTDRLDARKLLSMLLRYHGGERKLWSVVRVPSVEDEDWRHIHRELEELTRQRNEHQSRIASLLLTHGVTIPIRKDFIERLGQARQYDGQALPGYLIARIKREYELLNFVRNQIQTIESERKELFKESKTERIEKVRELHRLKGVGPKGSWLLVMEFFGWREFRNRKQVGSAAGLTGTPYNSGASVREQGISKAGNRRVRWMIVQLSWFWIRYQPDSALSRWYAQRYALGNSRQRRIGITAVARRLLIDLWRYLEQGVVPEGAVFKKV